MAARMGLPALPEGSPSSLLRETCPRSPVRHAQQTCRAACCCLRTAATWAMASASSAAKATDAMKREPLILGISSSRGAAGTR
jgi:hypothetical protein